MTKFKELVSTPHYRNAIFHLNTVLLLLLILFTAHHVFSRLGHAKVVDKFFFNSLPALICTRKSLYCDLLLFYGFVRSVMPAELSRFLYDTTRGCLLIRSQGEINKAPSLFHDEALEMGIIRHLNALGYTKFAHLENSVIWLKPFDYPFDSISTGVGYVGRSSSFRHEEFDDGRLWVG